MNKLYAVGSLFLILFVLVSVFKEDKVPNIKGQLLSTDAKILAFGDSLTYGKGAPSQSYPIQLEALTNLSVINAGISGEPSSKGLLRLPSLLKQHHPELVILCHGGNDIIQQKSKEDLKQNLIEMVRLSKESGAQVLLVGVPNFGLIGFSTEDLYKEIAEQEGIIYEGEVLSHIENDRSLKSDRIHPNAKGYLLMAKAFYEILQNSYVLKINEE